MMVIPRIGLYRVVILSYFCYCSNIKYLSKERHNTKWWGYSQALRDVFGMAIKSGGNWQACMAERGLSADSEATVLHGTNGTDPIDFGRINGLVEHEPGTMLQSSPDILRHSYERGLAAILRIDGEEAGYARLIPLLDDQLRERLGLAATGVNIYELGTVVVKPEYRGMGFSEEIVFPLLEDNSQSNLIISTTKSLALANALVKVSVENGLDYAFPQYFDYPGISALTCVCNPPFGGGLQHGGHCGLRVTAGNEYLPILNDPDRRGEISRRLIEGEKLGCCVLYVSDRALADRLEAELMAGVGGQQDLIGVLRSNGHYS